MPKYDRNIEYGTMWYSSPENRNVRIVRTILETPKLHVSEETTEHIYPAGEFGVTETGIGTVLYSAIWTENLFDEAQYLTRLTWDSLVTAMKVKEWL